MLSALDLRTINELITPKYLLRLYLLLIASVLMIFLELFSVGLIYPILLLFTDNSTLAVNQYLPTPLNALNPETLLITALLLLLAVYIIKNIYISFVLRWQSTLLYNIKADLETSLLDVYYNQDGSDYQSENSSHIRSLILVECGRLFTFALHPAITLITECTLILSFIAAFLFLTPLSVKLASLLIITTMVVIAFFTQKWVTARGNERSQIEQNRLQHLSNAIDGFTDALMLNQLVYFQVQFEKINQSLAKIESDYLFISSASRPLLELVGVFAFVFLTFSLLSSGYTAGAIIPIVGVFAAAAFRLLPSGTRVVQAYQSLKYASATINKLHKFRTRKLHDHTYESVKQPWKSLHVRNLSYTYAGQDKPIIDNLSLSIHRSQWFAITGPSGSGKSTLVKLLLGLYHPNAGEASLDGILETRKILKDGRFFGYVSQNVYLMNASIRENILFGRPTSMFSEEDVDHAVQIAGMESFVRRLPNELDTVIDENGSNLSGGERQRIGIARALLSKPEVLVLDEFTSALDKRTEKELLETLLISYRNRTLVIVSHKDLPLQYCDAFLEMPLTG